MNRLRSLFEELRQGKVDTETALAMVKQLPFEDIGFAKIDHLRGIRRGIPEVIYCEGKTIPQIIPIVNKLAAFGDNILATRASRDIADAIRDTGLPCAYHEQARIVVIRPVERSAVGNIAVVTAGTSDIPVAEEAAVTAETLGNRVNRIYDVGVAGIHRLFSFRRELFEANVIVVAAGMEGALASVVGGLVPCPVIGIPTSIGYGASFHGLAALLGMLNSCASGVSVVNIDNGFGAGFQASLINHLAEKPKGNTDS